MTAIWSYLSGPEMCWCHDGHYSHPSRITIMFTRVLVVIISRYLIAISALGLLTRASGIWRVSTTVGRDDEAPSAVVHGTSLSEATGKWPISRSRFTVRRTDCWMFPDATVDTMANIIILVLLGIEPHSSSPPA